MDYERLIVDNLPLVDSVVHTIARRHHLSDDEEDELGSSIRLKLVENEYEVLRKFEGRSQLRTYLITVVQRHFLDARNARWGKWRPSALARRLGPVAVLLDRLLTRDRLSLDHAVQAILTTQNEQVTREELEAIACQLPSRSSRVFLGEDDLQHMPAPAVDGDAIESDERRQLGDRVGRALASILERLDDEDRLILRLRFCENLKIGRIAELVGAPAKPFYRRVDDLMRMLRKALQAEGVSDTDVAAIVGHPDTGIEAMLDQVDSRKSVRGPSVP